MNYRRIYDELIGRARERGSVDGYSERHHITPRSHGGSDDQENLAVLTAREHFVAHWLLWRIHRDQSTACSLALMTAKGKDRNSVAYNEARIARNSKIGAAVSRALSGRKQTEEHKRNAISNRKTWSPHSDESRIKISEGRKGKGLGPRPAEVVERIAAAQRGVPCPARRHVQPKIKCIYCGTEASKGLISRWHDKNCRHRATQINEVQ